MAIKLNNVTYAHTDGTIVVTPREGDNAGIPFELRAVASFEWDPGAGSDTAPGLDVGPEGIYPTAAKPTWAAGLSKLGESMALAAHLGEGAVTIPCDVVLTLQRTNAPTSKVEIIETLITKGLGAGKSDSGSNPKSDIGGNCVDIKVNGKSLLNRPRA